MKGEIFMGKYEVQSLLGEGGMGRVYLAHQYDLKRKVVVKVMHDHIASDPVFRDRFESETLLMAQFQHPYSVTLYDATLADPKGPCIVMEYIRGVTLDRLRKDSKTGRFTPARTGRFLSQLCEVLHAAHSMGMVHRDLKPANIMVVEADSPYEKIKVMDFGLARLRGEHSLREIADTHGEVMVGTPVYMCPEQVRGEKGDHRGDLYSVGVILFELLTGRLPFRSDEPMDVMLAHATEEPPTFKSIGADGWASKAIEQVVRSCLAKDPDERPVSARELAENFERALKYGKSPPRKVQDLEEVSRIRRRRADETQPIPPMEQAQAEEDPSVMTFHLEAWMPETIAAYKLLGFVNDVGGDVIENSAGRILVRVGKPGTTYAPKKGALSWLIGKKASIIEMELILRPANTKDKAQLLITVVMRSSLGELPTDLAWKARCEQVFVGLRAYLMGEVGKPVKGP